MAKPFDNHPWFYEDDNRKTRPFHTITKETLEKTHKALLPENILKDKTILDIWSCMWATWQWCLFYWAKKYTWVELQEEYAEKSKKLLKHHWEKVEIICDSIENFFKYNNQTYDIVVLTWVIFVFIDYYLFLKNVTNICNETIVLNSIWPNPYSVNRFSASVEIMASQSVNLANSESAITWIWSRPTPYWLDVIMSTFGFQNNEWLIFPEKINDSIDVFNIDIKTDSWRFMLRYYKTNIKQISLSEDLQWEKKWKIYSWSNYNKNTNEINLKNNPFEFNDEIARNFKEIARKEIPNYLLVIKKCLEISKNNLLKDSKILDVWSAVWETLEYFYKAWFKNIYWVEKSKSMIDSSFNLVKIIHSDIFPIEYWKFDLIMANWTLHFINERQKYINDIFNWLNENWLFILTEKVTSSNIVWDLYKDIKRKNWVSEDEIIKKEKSLIWVLNQYPVEWYFDVLKRVWFKSIDIIDSNYCFVTFLAKK